MCALGWPSSPGSTATKRTLGGCGVGRTRERRAGRSLSLRNTAVVVMSLVALLTLSAVEPIGGDRFVVFRNAILLLGLGLGLATSVPRSLALLLLPLVPIASLLLGTNLPGIPPEAWAVVMHDGTSRVSGVAAAVAFATGTIWFFVARPKAT